MRMVIKLNSLYGVFDNFSFGRVGDTTSIKDYKKNPIYVGDVVDVISPEGKVYTSTVVLKTPNTPKGCFMGVKEYPPKSYYIDDDACEEDWIVIKVKSFTEMHNGDVVNCAKYVQESE